MSKQRGTEFDRKSELHLMAKIYEADKKAGLSGPQCKFKASPGKVVRYDLKEQSKNRAGDIAQWSNACLACSRV